VARIARSEKENRESAVMHTRGYAP
jgi:hypothetical protein